MKTKILRFLRTIGELAAMMAVVVIIIKIGQLIDPAFAADQSALPLSDTAKGVYKDGALPTPPEKTGQVILKEVVMGALVYAKVIIGAIGVLYITILGYKLVQASGEEEEITKAKRGLIYTVIAFVMVSMSGDIGKIFDMESKTLLSSPQDILSRVRLFDKQVEIFMTFVKYVIGAFAAIMVVQAGVKLITSGGEEEEVSKHKKSIMFSAGGLIIIYVGEIFINKVFYKVDKTVYTGITGVHPAIDAKEGVSQIAGVTNFVVAFAGPVAVLMLMAGAIMYATAGGEEEKMNEAKRLIVATIAGIIIIYGAFAIVSTIISSKLTEVGAMLNT
jgi:Type IV secretion system pilin